MIVLTKSLPHSQPNSDCSMATAPPGRRKTRGALRLGTAESVGRVVSALRRKTSAPYSIRNRELTLVGGPHLFVLQSLRCRPGFQARLVLAPPLACNYGLYNGFELCKARAVPGKEEYLDQEKYEIRAWDWDREGNIGEDIALVNRLRQTHPALQQFTNLRFYNAPVAMLARALAEGYIYQGEPSAFRDCAKRGEPSAGLPPTAFINFLQNHDQAGNRALGERLSSLALPKAIEALTAVLLLSPQVPLLFMGEEWGETRPFYFFTDFQGGLARQVREGRLNEFGNWQSFSDPGVRARIPDPNAMATFEASKIDWSERALPKQRQRLALVKRLLDIRRREIAPRLACMGGNAGQILIAEDSGLAVSWRLGDGSDLLMVANLSGEAWALLPALPEQTRAAGKRLYETKPGCEAGLQSGTLPPWSVVVRSWKRPHEPARGVTAE